MPIDSRDLDIEPLDLSEAPRMAKESYPRGLVVGAALLGVLFVGLLIHGSLPELSPSEIIAMDGYAGERPTKHIFNLQSFEKTEANTLPAKTVAKQDVPTSAGAPIVVQAPKQIPIAKTRQVDAQAAETKAAESPVAETKTAKAAIKAVAELPIAETIPVETAKPVVEVKIAQPVESKIAVAQPEAAATVLAESNVEKVVAAVPTTPTVAEVPTTVVIASVVADAPSAMPIKRNDNKISESAQGPAVANGAKDAKGRLLPLRTVLKDYTEVKQSPSAQARTVMSLGKGVVVTAFERQGDWIHIGTNDGSSVTGYVRESQVGPR